MTDAERILWKELRAHRLNELSFRRQVPIGRYIVDFVCHANRLIIELDGGQHATSKSDEHRDLWLTAKGYRVLRFWNSDVLQNLSAVKQTIVDAIRVSTPLPTPPPQGGREETTRGNQP